MNHFRFNFHPRLFDELRHYSRASYLCNLSAGLTVVAVALPLAMALVITSDGEPETRFTKLIAGILIRE